MNWRRAKRRTLPAISQLVLVLSSLIMLAPLLWMVSTSLKASGLSLAQKIEWMPWQDVWRSETGDIPVITLSAKVQRPDSGASMEVSIASLDNRDRVTRISLPDEQFHGEIIAYRVRPIQAESETVEAVWIPFAQLEREIRPQWRNYREALEKMRFWLLLKNTIAVTFLGTLGTILSSSFVAFGFARFRFPGRDTLFIILLSSIMLPPVVTMVPVYLIYRELGWIDTLLPLFFPSWFGLSAFAVFLFRQYFMTLPFDFDDAARIDGCNSFRIYWNVILPLAKPVMATVGMFCFTGYWLDFMSPLIYLNRLIKFTLSLGLYMFKGPYDVQWNYLMAATLIVSLPCVIAFFLGQRVFIRGVIMSGIKG